MEQNIKINAEGGKKEMEINEIAQENFKVWAESLKTKDPKKVAELYSDDATFLPTVSGEFKHGQEEAEGYFQHFLEKNPEGKIVAETIQPLGENVYLQSGLYNFQVDKNGSRGVVEARFSFVWKKESDEKWKITHHHSSVRPT